MKKIGIIGAGFVGKAVIASYVGTDVTLVVRDPQLTNSATIDDILNTDAIFVCVPSPSKADGSCDSSILESVLGEIKDYKNVIISKVTITPDVYRRLQRNYESLVYVPEFLTAANAVSDYLKGDFLVVGGIESWCKKAVDAITASKCRPNKIRMTDIKTASLMKYTINSFLATKVAFMNEIYEIAKVSNVDYNSLAELVNLDTRIGTSHMKVPGPDGFGFAGACFPKDVNALVYYAEKMANPMLLLEEVLRTNDFMRTKNE